MRNQSLFQSVKRTTASLSSSIEESAGMLSDAIKLERIDMKRNKLMNDTTDYVVANMENQQVAKSLASEFKDLDTTMVDETTALLEQFLKSQLKANLQ